MKLEQQVTSLELSKKLKELGVKQESLCFWEQAIQTRKNGELVWYLGVRNLPNSDWCSAFTVAELATYLNIKNEALIFHLVRHMEGDWFLAPYGNIPHFQDKNMANCFAKMLIYLIENKLI